MYSVTIQGKTYQLNFPEATVVHANKYNGSVGIYLWHLFGSNAYQDVVFKLKNTQKDVPLTLTSGDLPLYTTQQVKLICLDDLVVGYVDVQSNRYHYLNRNFLRLLGIGSSLPIAFLMLAILLVIVSFLLPGEYQQDTLFSTFVLCILFFIYRFLHNKWIERLLDKALQ